MTIMCYKPKIQRNYVRFLVKYDKEKFESSIIYTHIEKTPTATVSDAGNKLKQFLKSRGR